MPNREPARSLVAAEVRAEIAFANASQLAIAKATGIAHSTLNRKLNAKLERDVFDVDELERIAHVLRVPITRFFRTTPSRGPDDGGSSRLGESNPGPSHYREPVEVPNRTLSSSNVLPIERHVKRRVVVPFLPARKAA